MNEKVVVYAVSDMTGETVARVVRAASAQFETGRVQIKVLRHASSAKQIVDFIENQDDHNAPRAVFHTILDPQMRTDLRNALQTNGIASVDLLGTPAHVMSELLGKRPRTTPGITIEDGAEPTFFDLADDGTAPLHRP